MKTVIIYLDFQVLTTEVRCNINFFTSLGLFACLNHHVLKHVFEFMLYMVPTTHLTENNPEIKWDGYFATGKFKNKLPS